jgi:hypothetical protein
MVMLTRRQQEIEDLAGSMTQEEFLCLLVNLARQRPLWFEPMLDRLHPDIIQQMQNFNR